MCVDASVRKRQRLGVGVCVCVGAMKKNDAQIEGFNWPLITMTNAAQNGIPFVFNIFHWLPLNLCVILENAQKSDFSENEWLHCGVCAFKPLKCCRAHTKVWKKEKEPVNNVRLTPISYSFAVSVHDDASKEGSLHRVNRIEMNKGTTTTSTTTNNDSFHLSFFSVSLPLCSARDRFAFVLFISFHWGTVSISTAKVRCTECRTLEYNWQHNLLNQSTNISMPLDQLCNWESKFKTVIYGHYSCDDVIY